MNDKLRDRLIERLYPTATFVFILVTTVIWGALWLDLAPDQIEMALINGWFTYLGGFAGYMFGHEPAKDEPTGPGMSEALAHKTLAIVEMLVKGKSA